MQWYVTSVSRGSLYEKFGNKCENLKILDFKQKVRKKGGGESVPRVPVDILKGKEIDKRATF
jgi:hypothetical protein